MPGSRRLTLAGTAAAATAAILVTVAALHPAQAPALRTVTPTSTTAPAAPPTTSTSAAAPVPPVPPVPPIEPTETEVATAVGNLVAVVADLPDDAEALPAAVVRMADLATVGYSPERAGSPEIPSFERPVEGRRRTATGWEFDNPTPFGNPLSFAVTERRGDWVRVLLPVRPNGTQGWLRAADVAMSVIDTRVVVDLSDAALTAFAGREVIARSPVVIGRPSTPTPTGRYFVTDHDPRNPGSAYGPWVLPLSGFSQAMDSFAGGVPVLAMHGTNRPELVGGAYSNGCLRMPNDVIDALRARLPLGTPVDIVA